MNATIKRHPIWVIIVIVGVCFPIALLFLWSFTSKWMYPAIFPQTFSLQTFFQMLDEPNFFPAVINTLVISLGTTLTSLLIALPAARYLAFQHHWSQRVIEISIYVPLILPAIAIITSSQVLFLQLHLTGSFVGVILIHTYFCLPYAMQILLASYRQLGEGYQLTAESLGAKPGMIFWQITWPLIRPGIITASSFVLIISSSQYLPTFFIGGGKIITLPLLLLPYANNGRLALASSYSLIFLTCMLFGLFILKRLIGGSYRGNKR